MTTTLYGCKRTQDHETFLIAKFDESLVIQASYFVGARTCQCEGFAKRKQCKHLTIRTMFMMNKHCDDGFFLDFENRRWREYPQLLEDGTVGDFKERFDALSIGDGGYATPEADKFRSLLAEAAVATPAATAAPEGLRLSPSGAAPEVEPPPDLPAPSGAPIRPPQDGIKRRFGL